MRKAGIFMLILALCLLLTACGEQKAYDEACALFENGSYVEAIEMFRALGDYSDCVDRVRIAETRLEQSSSGRDAGAAAAERAAKYADAFTFLEQGRTRESFACFSALGSYRDAAEYIGNGTESILRGTAEYNYGADGKAVSRSGFCKLDKYGWFEDFNYHYSYNENGFVSRIDAVNTAGNLSFTIDYEYNENGRPVRESYSDSNGKSHVFTYDYDFVDATDSGESYTAVRESELFNGNVFPQDERQERYCEFGVASVKGKDGSIVYRYEPDGKRSSAVQTTADGRKTVTYYFYDDVYVYTPAG